VKLSIEQEDKLRTWLSSEFPFWPLKSLDVEREANGTLGVVVVLDTSTTPFHAHEPWQCLKLPNGGFVCCRSLEGILNVDQ